MKINEVEAQVGVTKKNIRFYEEKGLIAPRRNSENGYREYGPGEVEQLKQIKLLRKLGVPLEEIRRMQSGGHTVGDGMRRHLVTLERERENLERSMELCRTLKDWEQRLDTLEADGLLERMEEMEREGTTFKDKQREDARPVRYAAAVAASLIMVAFMAGGGGPDGLGIHCGAGGGPAAGPDGGADRAARGGDPWGAVRPVPADPGDPEGRGGRCEKLLKGRGWPAGPLWRPWWPGWLCSRVLGWLRCGGRCQPPLPCWLWPVWRLSWPWPQVSLRPCSTGGRRSGEVRRTKQKNTDWEQAEQKREAVKSVLISAGFRVGAAALLFCARGRTPWPRLHRVLLWLAVLALITIPFSLVVLRQRLREIEGGELNEARKY